jgi:hypothetical protein
MAIRKILKDFKSKGDGFKRSLICDLYSDDSYWRKKTTLNYDVEGWWGSPVSVRLEEENDRGLTVEIHTSSGGQNGDVSGLEKVRNLISVLKDAEKQILEAQ